MWQVAVESPGSPDVMGDVELTREVNRRRKRHPSLPSILDPGVTLHGWQVYAFPWPSEPGPPRYRIFAFDESAVSYEAKRH